MKRLFLALMLAWSMVAVARAAEPGQLLVMLHLPAQHYRADLNYTGAYRNDAGRSARRKVAQELATRHGLRLVSDWPMPLIGVDCYVMALPAGADGAALAALIAADPRVEWAQPVSDFRTLASLDPLLPVQPAAAQWHLEELHRSATGRGVTVAVIDSGVDEQHPELAGQLQLKKNFIDASNYRAENHGTAVAGVIAARAGNGVGIRGVSPSARLLALRACREDDGPVARCDSFSLAKALQFAIMQTPRIINMSLTGPSDRLLKALIDTASARGIVVVGALDPDRADGGFPASLPDVVAVSAASAPGRDIPVPAADGGFRMVSGSSYAAAHVSGLLALIGELRPHADGAQLRGFLHAGLAKVASPPVLDACGAMAQAASHCICACLGGGGLKAMR